MSSGRCTSTSPTLAVITRVSAPSVIGSDTAVIKRCARSSARLASGRSGHRITNSSPPMRATVSPGRTETVRRLATSTSTASPMS